MSQFHCFTEEQASIVHLKYILFTCSSADGLLVWLCSLAIVKRAALSMGVCIHLLYVNLHFLGYGSQGCHSCWTIFAFIFGKQPVFTFLPTACKLLLSSLAQQHLMPFDFWYNHFYWCGIDFQCRCLVGRGHCLFCFHSVNIYCLTSLVSICLRIECCTKPNSANSWSL